MYPSLLTYIIIGVLIFLLFGFYIGKNEAKRAVQQATSLLKIIDSKYEDFTENRIRLALVKEENIHKEQEKIVQETLMILQPEIDALLASINSLKNSDVKLQYQSKYFGSLSTLIESMYARNRQDSDNKLSTIDEEFFKKSVEASIYSDIAQRVVQFKSIEY